MTPRGLGWRVGGGLALFVVLYVVFRIVDFEPHALPLLLVVLLGVVGLGLVVDALGGTGPSWTVDMSRPATPPGQDPRFSLYLRTLEHHRTAATPDTGVRDRLATLAALRLEQRHGPVDGTRRAELLGPDLTAVLDGPPRRLGATELDRHLRRIEEL